MTRRTESLLVRVAFAAFVSLPISGCVAGEEFQRGYLLDERMLAQVKPGMSAEQVLQTLGTPSTVSTVGNKSWYYISQTARRPFKFMSEKIVDQRVTAVYFNKSLRVERVALYGLQDGKLFDFVSRSTPGGGQDASFVSQLFRGLGTFNPL